jgi:hypothetical protein
VDRYQQKLSAFGDASVSGVIATGDTSTKVLIAAKASFCIFVQKIFYLPTTSAAQILKFQDNASTPIIAGVIPASPTVDVEIIFDWGPDGLQLTEGKELDMTIAGAGQGGTFLVQAYQRLMGVTTPFVGNTVGGGTPGTNHG